MELTGSNITVRGFNQSGYHNSTHVTEIFRQFSLGYFLVVSVISAVGTSGNMLVLLSIVYEKKLRTVANYLIGHLAIIDMLTCCAGLPTNMAIRSISSPAICGLLANTFALLPNLSIHGQCLISINRYVLVAQPVSVYRTWFSKTRSSFAILLIWILNTVILLTMVLFLSKPVTDDSDICDMSEDPAGTKQINQYILGLSCISAFAVSFIFYGKLIKFARKNPMSLTAVKRAESKTSMTLLRLLIVFGLSLIIPPILLYLNNILILDTRGILDEVMNCLMYINYGINPIFYGFKIRLFQQTYTRLLYVCMPKNKRIAPVQSNQPTRSTNV